MVAPVSGARTLQPWLAPGPSLNILVQRLGCSYTERLLTLFAAKSRRPYRLLELGTLEGMLGFIELGLGLAVMPRAFIASAGSKRALALLELPRPLRSLRTYLVAPAAADCTFAANAFFTTHAAGPASPRARAGS
ncbi:MAG: LysR substrate-binding domain-containing protein [Verrucomicrobia bacterium]|nr:LysR substrate-binding domain-containing protein [Verrucomicrobiota bacterium]